MDSNIQLISKGTYYIVYDGDKCIMYGKAEQAIKLATKKQSLITDSEQEYNELLKTLKTEEYETE